MARLNWTLQAKDDLRNIRNFLSAQSRSYAKVQIKRIFERIQLLHTFPSMGRILPELEYERVRELIVGPYRIVYHLVSDNRIDILTIHHSARPLNIKDI